NEERRCGHQRGDQDFLESIEQLQHAHPLSLLGVVNKNATTGGVPAVASWIARAADQGLKPVSL
ncbi:MAG: hypothetical protein ABW054_06360, partial [Casimicrobiaceae bacterium]